MSADLREARTALGETVYLPERRTRDRVNDVADRRKYAAMLLSAADHLGAEFPAAARYLEAESERIDTEAAAALAEAMKAAGARRITPADIEAADALLGRERLPTR